MGDGHTVWDSWEEPPGEKTLCSLQPGVDRSQLIGVQVAAPNLALNASGNEQDPDTRSTEVDGEVPPLLDQLPLLPEDNWDDEVTEAAGRVLKDSAGNVIGFQNTDGTIAYLDHVIAAAPQVALLDDEDSSPSLAPISGAVQLPREMTNIDEEPWWDWMLTGLVMVAGIAIFALIIGSGWVALAMGVRP
jgi:hypothetical protein